MINHVFCTFMTASQDALVNGPLGKSGFLAAFSLIFLSEIGDKTFFIAALLAMKLGKWISYAGSLASLTLMTIVSVAIGAVFSRVGAKPVLRVWQTPAHPHHSNQCAPLSL